MKTSNHPSLGTFLEWLAYDQSSGLFTRKKTANTRFKIGEVAGSINSKGYLVIKIQGANYKAHRLAWLFSYGDWPTGDLDHINGVKTDNRIDNLRLASSAENNSNVTARANNKSGYKGVVFHAHTGKWMASCGHNKKRHYLGLFDTPHAASAAYLAFAQQAHAEFFNNSQT